MPSKVCLWTNDVAHRRLFRKADDRCVIDGVLIAWIKCSATANGCWTNLCWWLNINYHLPRAIVSSQKSMFLSCSAITIFDIVCSSLRPLLVHCEKTSIWRRPPRWIGSIPIPARAYWLSSKLICVSRALVCWIQSDIRCQFWWSSAFGLFFLFGCNLVSFFNDN